ncbi:hypothetical protein [Streptomyces yanii]|uniref:Uncharacterized protein n=1 Tax=Streptomyces yanii TaxID=78510 RepID=A0ABV5R295_9ACTN
MLRLLFPCFPFEQLPADIRQIVADKTGAVHQVVTVRDGMNSGIASVLETESGSVFVKGHPGRPSPGRCVAP